MKLERLVDIAEIKTGKYDANHSTDDGQYIFYTCAFGQFKSPTYSFEGDAIILPGNGANVGEVFFNDGEKFEVYQRTYVIQNIKAYSKYVYYFFKHSWKRSLTNSQYGSATNYIRMNNLTNFQIPIPSINDQIHIANILTKAENLIAQRKESIRLLDEYLKSTFLDMFGDPVSNKKNFKIVTVDSISTAIKDGPHVSPKYVENGIPILSTRNIRPGKLIFEEVKYVSKETYMELTKKFTPQKGDVLITKGGTTGYAKVVDFDFDFCIWVHLAIVRLNNSIHPIYFEHAMNSNYCYNQSQRYTHGITNRDLGLTRIAKIKLLLPPIELQTQFAQIVEKTEALKVQYQQSLQELENLYGSLSQRAFKGELTPKEYKLPDDYAQNSGLGMAAEP